MDIGRNHFYVTVFSNASIDLYPIILAPFSRRTSHIPSICGERRLPSGKWAYVKSHMAVPRTNSSHRIRVLTRRWYLFIVTSSHRSSWRIKSPNVANNSLPVGGRGTPFSKRLLSPRGKKSLSGYQYSDATDGRFDGPFRSRNITRKNGTTFSARGINTRDVSSYRHYQS